MFVAHNAKLNHLISALSNTGAAMAESSNSVSDAPRCQRPQAWNRQLRDAGLPQIIAKKDPSFAPGWLNWLGNQVMGNAIMMVAHW